jgi:Ca-activated chloride channel family protein
LSARVPVFQRSAESRPEPSRPKRVKLNVKRGVILTVAVLVLAALGSAYPLLARGPELLHARWGHPLFLLGLVLVPFVFVRAVFGDDRRTPRLRLGTIAPLVKGPTGVRVWLRDVPGAARALGLALCVAALARPMNTLRPVSTEEEGIDIVIALDLSGSMRAVMDNIPDDLKQFVPPNKPGFRPTRLDAARAVLRDFIARRKTDRIGVVIFGQNAYIVSPPTLDYHLLDSEVARMQLGLINGDGTAIGDAVGVSAARLRRSTAKSKAIILLTDGDNRGGKVSPYDAARIANTVGAKIYSVQIGQGEDAFVQSGIDLFGQPRYSRENFPVNPKLLKDLANQTGGATYVATDARALQASLHDVLDQLEKTKLTAGIASYEELYRFLLLPGVLLLALDALLRALVTRRFP